MKPTKIISKNAKTRKTAKPSTNVKIVMDSFTAESLMKALRPPRAKATSNLFAGIRAKNIEAVKQAIEDGADVNALEGRNLVVKDTPLTLAMYRYIPIEIFHALLAAGADVNKPNSDKMMPLVGAAVRRVGEERINALMERGARDVPDAKGRKPSDYARIHYDYGTQKLIEEWKPSEKKEK